MTRFQASAKPKGSALDTFVRRIDEISTLPQIALRVMEVADDPASAAADLKAVMESDASLSARVLRCVNSSAYAVRTKITNLQQAIAYVGLKQVRNLALTASVSELFKKNETIGCYRRMELWRHLVAVGLCARLIAMRREVSNFEDAFLAGLLHDIGIILLDQHAHTGFERVIRSLGSAESLCKAERSEFDFDHTAAGAAVADMWGFPEVVRSAIRFHHSSAGCRTPALPVVQCVEMANLICTIKGMSSVGAKLVKFNPSVLEGLALSSEDITVLAEDLDKEIERNDSLFQL